jgi:hypothetical protein
MVHQNFASPVLFNWFWLNYYPSLRRLFMVRAFKRFFRKTLDNICRVAERTFEPIGRPWIPESAVSTTVETD